MPHRTKTRSRRLLRAGRELTLGRLFREGYVALVALLFLLVGLGYLIDPGAVGRAFTIPYPYDLAVNALYALGGATVLVGFLDRRPGIESAGHTLLVPALLTSFAFAAFAVGLHTTTVLSIVFAVSSALRAYGLILRWQETLR